MIDDDDDDDILPDPPDRPGPPDASLGDPRARAARPVESTDERMTFLVVATVPESSFSSPHFVRAASLGEAYAQVFADHAYLGRSRVSLEGFVIGADAMGSALNLRRIARSWWMLGRLDGARGASGRSQLDVEEEFEAAWEEHGAEISDDDLPASSEVGRDGDLPTRVVDPCP